MRPLRFAERISLISWGFSIKKLLWGSPHWSPDQMQHWQFQRIQKLVSHAYQNVPFYKDLYLAAGFNPGDLKTWSDFQSLPLVSRDQLIENFPDRILSKLHKPENLIVSRSSGSSGKVLDVAYEVPTLVGYALATLRLYHMGFKFQPWHRYVYIYTTTYPFNSVFGLYRLQFIPTLAPIEETLNVLRRVKPHVLVCYPSHMRQIANLANPDDLRQIHPNLISLNSEMVSQSELDHISSVFGCPTLDSYSSEEMGRIAAQCLKKTYHIFEDMNYMEILDEQQKPTRGEGTIVLTNLHNWTMPLIRYQQNDLGKIAPPGCSCGWNFRELEKLQGRRNDSFTLPSGKVLTSGFLLDATYEFLLKYRSAVRDYCLVQESPNSVFLEIVPSKGWNADIGESIAKRFTDFLEAGVAFRISVVEQCEKTRSGKRNPIINRMKRALPAP